ncbi:acyl-CoA oxidase [Lenzites betulinus]|nr:acyl-CoA oxidase [Lenzites betulinus]
MAPNQNVADMAEARRRGSVDADKLQTFLWGSEGTWANRKALANMFSTDPVFDKSKRPFLSRTEMYQRALAMTNRLDELKDQHGWSAQEVSLALKTIDEPVPFVLHNSAFEPVMMSQGSPELKKHYEELRARHGVFGCYLQTELGHGTNVAALETTATYLPETQEFEIHSPSLMSSKWWVGSLGKTATHGVVQARLILPGGKDVGPHLFFVQLRSTDNHKVLPGITVGDIGPKALGGYGGVDNGYARFDHVRVPRAHMLSGFASVTPDGQYVQPPHAKLSYGGVIFIRASMVVAGGWSIGKAVTIAIRYATVRRQGTKGADGLERQVITYPAVYYRLLPALARAYVFIVLGQNIVSWKMFSDMTAKLASGDTSSLAEVHATTSGLKTLVTTHAAQDLETARRSMGGHGFSEFAGVGRLYADYLPSVTYEGDNFVLDQQVVRAALKAYDANVARKDKSVAGLTPSSSYLRLLIKDEPQVDTSSANAWKDPRTSISLLERRAAAMVKERAQHRNEPDASSDYRVARAVTEAFVAVQVGDIIRTVEGTMPTQEAAVLRTLYLLHLLTSVEGSLADILSFDLLNGSGGATGARSDASRSLRMAIKGLCADLLPEAIRLTDGFGFNDWELDSALGRYDGNAYEALWARAQTEPLNQKEVPDGYEEYIKPFLARGQRLGPKL